MATRWTRRLADVFTERLGYKAAAVLFAIALWVAASGGETATRYVPVRFVTVVDPSLRLVGPPPVVRALVSGPTRELLKLYADPPAVRREFGAGTAGALTVELGPGDVDLPSGVERVSVRGVRPRSIALHFQSTRPRVDTVGVAP